MTDGFHPVDQFALFVPDDEIFIAGVLDEAGDPLQAPVPVFLFPLIAFGRPVENLPQAMFIRLGEAEETGTLGAKRPFVDRVIGITFDVENFPGQLVRAADQTTAHRTVAADGGRLLGCPDPVHLGQPGGMRPQRRQVKTKRGQGDS